MLELFPESAAVEDGELVVGGVRTSALAEEFGTPLVVYCEQTIRSQARAYRSVDPDALVVHGNNKSDDELRAAAKAGALVVLDSIDEVERAAAAAPRAVLVRVTPGIEAETHQSIQTAHSESKFGLAPDDALAAVRAGLDRKSTRLNSSHVKT